MSDDVNSLLVKIEATTAQLRQEMLRGEQVVASTTGNINNNLSKMDKKFDESGASAASMGTAVAGISGAAVAGITGLVALTVKAAETAKEIENLAQVSNASVVEFQRYAAGAKTVGIEQDKLADIFKDVNDKMGEYFRENGGEMEAFFKNISVKVGVTAESFRNLSGPQALQLYYDSLIKAGVGQQELTTYMEEIGDEATALIPLLRDNGAGFAAAAEKAERMGAILSELDIQRLQEVNKTISQLQMAFAGASNELIQGMMPAITDVTTNLNNWSDNGSIQTLGNGIGWLVDHLDVITALLGGAATIALARYAGELLSSAGAAASAATAAIKQGAAVAGAAQADTAAAKSAHAKAMADRAAAVAELDRLKSVQAALTAEKALEVQRLKAQISDAGRQQSVARMAELRLAEAAILKQVTAAENARTQASVAANAAASGAVGIGGRLLGLLGGPAGLATLAIGVGAAFMLMGDNAVESLEDTKQSVEKVRDEFAKLTRDQQEATRVKWAEKQVAALSELEDAYADLGKKLNASMVTAGDPTSDRYLDQTTQLQKFTAELDKARASGADLSPILQEIGAKLGVSQSSIDSWVAQAGVVSDASVKTRLIADVMQQLTGTTQQNTAATNDNNAAKSGMSAAAKTYLKTLEDELAKLEDNGDAVKEANRYIKEHIEISEDEKTKILAAAAAKKARDEANKAEAKSESAATSAAKKHTEELERQRKALTDALEKHDATADSLQRQTAAHQAGGEAVAESARQEEIETEVLEHGEAARAKLTAAINAEFDARDRFDLVKSTQELERETAQLEKEAVATLLGADALAQLAAEKQLAALMAGKHTGALSAEQEQLAGVIKANQDAAKTLNDMASVSGILDDLYPEKAARREYEEDQRRLYEAMALMPEKAGEYRQAISDLTKEYSANSQKADQWAVLTEGALDRIDSGFADMWKSAFTEFENFSVDLKEAFFGLLAELAHAAITKPIVMQIGASMGIGSYQKALAESNAGGASLFDLASSAYSAYNAGSGNGVLGQVWDGLQSGGLSGAWGAFTNTGLFAGLDQTAGQVLGTLSNGAGMTYAPASYQMANGGLGGLSSYAPWLAGGSGALYGFSQGGLAGAAAGGLGSYGGFQAGAALGSLAGPIGTAIGGAIGAALGGALGGSLFGGSGERFPEKYTAAGGYYDNGKYTATGTPEQLVGEKMFGAELDAYMSGVNEKFSSALGGLYEMFGDAADVTTDIYARLRKTSGKIAGDLWTTIDGESFHRFRSYGGDAKDIEGQLAKFADDVLGQFLAEAITMSDSLPEHLRAQFEGLAASADTTAEEVQAKLLDIIGRFDAVNSALEMVGIKALETSNAGLIAADNIAALSGGYEQLTANVSGFYQNFVPEAEKVATLLEDIPAAFEAADLELPDTRAEYRAMAKDIDATTEAGQQMFADLMSMQESASAYYAILEAKAENLLALEQNYYNLFASDEIKQLDGLMAIGGAFRELGVHIPATREGFVDLVDGMDRTTEAGRATYEGLLGLADAAKSYYDNLEAAEAERIAAAQALAAAERSEMVDSRRAMQQAEAELRAKQIADFEALTATYNEQRSAMLAAGDAAGYLAASVGRAVLDPANDSAPQTNFQWAQLLAREGFSLANELSRTALTVQDVGAAIASARSNFADLSDAAPLVQGYVNSFLGAVDQGSSEINSALRSVASGIAQVQISGTYRTGQAGIEAILEAQSWAGLSGDRAAGSVYAGGGWQYGTDVIAYAKALDALNSLLKAGTVTADEYANAVADINDYVGASVSTLLNNTEAQLGRMELAQHEVALAGSQAIEFYIDTLDEMAQAAVEASEPLQAASGAIERLSSMAYAFGLSAEAAQSAGSYAPGFGPDYSANADIAELIADYAQRAADALTTADAAKVAETLEQSAAFADLTGTALRDVAMLLDGIGQYDAESFEAAFVRISDALADGTINAAQYGELFELAMDSFEGAGDESEAAAALLGRVNAVLSDMAKTLLPLDDLGEAAAQRMAELAGGIEAFESGAETWFSQFFTEAEQQARLMTEVEQSFAEAGLSLSGSRDEFHALVDAISTGAEAGQDTLAKLLGLMDEADAYYDILDAREEEKRKAEAEHNAQQEALLSVYQRLRNAAADVGIVMEGMTLITPQLIQSFADLAEEMGGIDQVESALSGYYQNFFTEAERQQTAIEGMTSAFAEAGLTLPTARDGFREMMDSIDPTTEAGRSMFATLLGLADTAAAYFNEIERQEAERQAAIAELYQLFTPEQTRQANQLADFREEMEALGVTLPDSRWQFGELVNGIDQTTEAGAALYEALLNVRNGAADYYALLEANAMSEAETTFARLQRATAAETAQIQTALQTRLTDIEAYYNSERVAQTASFDAQIAGAKALAEEQEILRKTAQEQALATLEDGYSAQKEAAAAAFEAQQSALEATQEAAKGLVSSLSDIFRELESGLEQLMDSSEASVAARRETAKATVQQAISWGRGGRSVAEVSGLSEAIAKVAELTTDPFASAEDFKREQGRSANLLNELSGLTGAQLSAQEQLLASLERQLETLKSQHEAAADQQQALYAAAEEALKTRFEAEQQAAENALEATLQTLERSKEETLQRLEGMQRADAQAMEDSAQQQLDALSQQLEAAERQYNALKGIDDSIISVRDALSQWAAALQTANEVQGRTVEARFASLQAASVVTVSVPATPTPAPTMLGITGEGYDERQASGDAMQMAAYNEWLGRIVSGTTSPGDGPRYGIPLGADPELDAWGGGIPAFAEGGLHTGGLRLVGERGPELEITGPARYYSADQTAALMGGGQGSIAELRALRSDLSSLFRLLQPLGSLQNLIDLLKRWDYNGLPEERIV